MLPASTLYSPRSGVHGSVPVHVYSSPRHFEVVLPEGVQSFPSARSLIASLTGKREHGLTFDRYFRVGTKWHPEPPNPTAGSILDLFMPVETPITVAPRRRKAKSEDESLTVALGIDLARRGNEVRKLFFAGFGGRVMRAGYDPDEVLQEIYRGILARNRGTCPFDAKKSSFGHYVHMVCGCILSNYHRKEQRRREFEQIGVPDPKDLDNLEQDASMVAIDRAEPSRTETKAILSLMRFAGTHLGGIGPKVVPLLAKGYTKREIARQLSVPMAEVSITIKSLQELAPQWAGIHA